MGAHPRINPYTRIYKQNKVTINEHEITYGRRKRKELGKNYKHVCGKLWKRHPFEGKGYYMERRITDFFPSDLRQIKRYQAYLYMVYRVVTWPINFVLKLRDY